MKIINQFQPTQLELAFGDVKQTNSDKHAVFNDPAFATNKSLPIHRWVPWIAGFSRDFVAGALSSHLQIAHGTILDPFAGVGTTLVEGMLEGHNVIGFEINPYPHLASQTKLNVGKVSAEQLEIQIRNFQLFYEDAVRMKRKATTSVPEGFQSRVPFYSPKVLDKVLNVLDFTSTIKQDEISDIFRLAFASTMVSYSNYSYEPSLGTRVSSGKQNVVDFAVGEAVLLKLENILADVKWFWTQFPNGIDSQRQVINDSFFNSQNHLAPGSVDLIITSPPYLNNYHYNRNTRPHLYWLGFAHKPSDFKHLEEANFGTYWQTARDHKRIDLEFVLPHSELADALEVLRKTNPDKGIYGGNGWANYAATYFNDCLKFAIQAKHVLKNGGEALVVIGNSILQGVMIPTDRYLADIAKLAGLECISIDIPRSTRVGNSIIRSEVRGVKASSKHQLYEAVVTLRKS